MQLHIVLLSICFVFYPGLLLAHGAQVYEVGVPTPPPSADNSSLIIGNLTENGHTCLRFEMTVHLNIKYNTTENKTAVVDILLPSNVTLLNTGSKFCSDPKYENLTFNFKNVSNLTLAFKASENSVFLNKIYLIINHTEELFPKSVNSSKLVPYLLEDLVPNFNVDKSHSYVCSNNVTIPKNDDKSKLHVIFSNLRIQAFMPQSQNGTFSEEHNCQNEINDVVPIAVGAALTGLVIIVLIAYFIGRRRSRRTAYQSV